MRDALAMMITMTTYGTPLQKAERRWVEEDLIMPAQPIRQLAEQQGRKYPPLCLPRNQLQHLGTLVGTALREQFDLRIWAMTVQTWYVHAVIGATREPAAQIVQCSDDVIRRALQLKRPIWEAGYDKRFCFDADTVRERIAYVERHNVAVGWPARPWPFIEAPGV